MYIVNELLVLKYSSALVARPTVNGSYVIDHATIRRNGYGISALLDGHAGLGLIVVTSAACNLVEKDAWSEVCESWNKYICRAVKGFQISDNDFDHKSEGILSHVVRGGVSVVNGDNKQLSLNSRWRNNDYVSADLIGKAAEANRFRVIELGMLTNVNGLLRDMNDTQSVLSVVSDIQAVRAMVTDTNHLGTTGGMSTKLDAVSIALERGVHKAWIAHGRAIDAIELAREGKIGTTFFPSGSSSFDI